MRPVIEKDEHAISDNTPQDTTAVRAFILFATFSPKSFLGGKSAVLTALTIALGGKATITGRGSGLKSFIKEGEE